MNEHGNPKSFGAGAELFEGLARRPRDVTVRRTGLESDEFLDVDEPAPRAWLILAGALLLGFLGGVLGSLRSSRLYDLELETSRSSYAELARECAEVRAELESVRAELDETEGRLLDTLAKQLRRGGPVR